MYKVILKYKVIVEAGNIAYIAVKFIALLKIKQSFQFIVMYSIALNAVLNYHFAKRVVLYNLIN